MCPIWAQIRCSFHKAAGNFCWQFRIRHQNVGRPYLKYQSSLLAPIYYIRTRFKFHQSGFVLHRCLRRNRSFQTRSRVIFCSTDSYVGTAGNLSRTPLLFQFWGSSIFYCGSNMVEATQPLRTQIVFYAPRLKNFLSRILHFFNMYRIMRNKKFV